MAATSKKVSKTKVARATVITVLTKANTPMQIGEIIENVLATKAVRDAGVPKGTISAQINFELAEAEPRIVRHGRGVYAAVGVEAVPESEAK